jgi:6-phosphogluconolactonase
MNELLFVGSYASAQQPGIVVFNYQATTGTLTPKTSCTGVVNPSFLIQHPNCRWLYAVSEIGMATHGTYGSVTALQLDSTDQLTLINQQSSGGDWPCHLQFDVTGCWLFVTNYGSGNMAVLPIRSDGSLGEMTDFVQHHGSGPNRERQDTAHAHASVITPDNNFVIVADLGTDHLMTYAFVRDAGKLVFQRETATAPGAGPRHFAFHPKAPYLYVANELNCTVTLYDYNAADGQIQARATWPTLPADAHETTVADLHCTADGTRLFVSNRGHNSLAAYAIAADGSLTSLAFPSSGGNWPRNFAIAPDDRHLLVANQYSGEVVVLPLLATPEAVGNPVARVDIPQASCVHFGRNHVTNETF